MNKLLLFVLAIAAVGCATTSVDSMRAESRRLEDRAVEFYGQIKYEGDNSRRDRVSRDAQMLVESSRRLNRAIELRASSDQLISEFDIVSRDYDQLHKDLADAGYADQNRRVLEDFDRVTDAYRVVEGQFATRYSRVGYDSTRRPVRN